MKIFLFFRWAASAYLLYTLDTIFFPYPTFSFLGQEFLWSLWDTYIMCICFPCTCPWEDSINYESGTTNNMGRISTTAGGFIMQDHEQNLAAFSCSSNLTVHLWWSFVMQEENSVNQSQLLGCSRHLHECACTQNNIILNWDLSLAYKQGEKQHIVQY